MAETRRNTADGVLQAVALGGRITMPTLVRLLELLPAKTTYRHHIEIAIDTGALLKTLDNEEDALETIRRLESAPDRIAQPSGAPCAGEKGGT